MHSHTYAGNPLACAAALSVLTILQREDILKKAAKKAIYLHNMLEDALGSHQNIGEIRHIGLINALELVKNKKQNNLSMPNAVLAGTFSAKRWTGDLSFVLLGTCCISIPR